MSRCRIPSVRRREARSAIRARLTRCSRYTATPATATAASTATQTGGSGTTLTTSHGMCQTNRDVQGSGAEQGVRLHPVSKKLRSLRRIRPGIQIRLLTHIQRRSVHLLLRLRRQLRPPRQLTLRNPPRERRRILPLHTHRPHPPPMAATRTAMTINASSGMTELRSATAGGGWVMRRPREGTGWIRRPGSGRRHQRRARAATAGPQPLGREPPRYRGPWPSRSSSNRACKSPSHRADPSSTR
jgi:hypothetical protein